MTQIFIEARYEKTSEYVFLIAILTMKLVWELISKLPKLAY